MLHAPDHELCYHSLCQEMQLRVLDFSISYAASYNLQKILT